MDGLNYTCAHCGVGFVTFHKNKIYCSRKCNVAAWKLRNPDRLAESRAEDKEKYNASRPVGNVFLCHCSVCTNGFFAKRKKKRCSRACELEEGRRKAKEAFVSKAVKEQRQCTVCGKLFITNTAAQHTCSSKCSKKKYGRHYRDRARHYGVEYEPVNVQKVFARDGWKCQICGKQTPETRRGSRYSNAPELDHRIPISKGGPHTAANVQCACRQCNGRKSNTASTGQLPLLA